jgi:hypothetical protein
VAPQNQTDLQTSCLVVTSQKNFYFVKNLFFKCCFFMLMVPLLPLLPVKSVIFSLRQQPRTQTRHEGIASAFRDARRVLLPRRRSHAGVVV